MPAETTNSTVNTVHEDLAVQAAGETFNLNVEVREGTSRVADQRSACLSIIALDRLETVKKDIKKALKAVDLQTELGILDPAAEDEIRSNAEILEAQTAAQESTLRPIMGRSTAFSVPVDTGTTMTPKAFTASTAALRKDTVKAAQSTLASL